MQFSPFRHHSKKRPQPRRGRQLAFDLLEDRTVPSTFSVLNLSNSGPGSLRQAILDANLHPGPDAIHFSVAGTVVLTTGALPAVNGTLDIDGSSAPGFASTPVLAIDYNHFGGIQLNVGSAGSRLRSLALINAGGAAVTITGAGNMIVAGNYIGLGLDGTTVAANGGNGVDLVNSSDNTIGGVAATDRNVISANHNNGI